MKKTLALLAVLTFTASATFSQTTFKEHKAGHVFTISLPDYMSKTVGLNSSASIQFKNTVKDIAGLVIEDGKEDLKLAEFTFSSVDEFYQDFIKDFAKDEKKRNVSKPESKKIGDNSFIECDVTYYDKESKIDIYYFVGIVETPTTFYKVLCYGAIDAKEKYKADFQKILYSIKD